MDSHLTLGTNTMNFMVFTRKFSPQTGIVHIVRNQGKGKLLEIGKLLEMLMSYYGGGGLSCINVLVESCDVVVDK